jgi:predicted site-specific integrase-resolvase
MPLKDEFVLVSEAAEMLGVCANTIRSWGANGKITEYRHPVNDYRMFKKKEIEQLITKMRKPIPHGHVGRLSKRDTP